MDIPVSITHFVKQPKFLPVNKIIRSRDFTAKHLSENALISEDDETITPSNFGTVLDYMTRCILLSDDHTFDLANIMLKRYLDQKLITADDVAETFDKELMLNQVPEKISNIDDIPDEAFDLATDICAWEIAYRTGNYVAPTQYPDQITVQHMKLMMKRIENFFNEYGWTTGDAFGASTKNGYLSGDDDYLLKNTLVDLKASNKTTMQIFWVRQLLLYYTLVFLNHLNDEKIDRLMIYNARADMIFYADMADIDDSVFEYVNDAAEKQSLVNEKLIKQMMGELNQLFMVKVFTFAIFFMF